MKETFIIRTEWIEAMHELSPAEQGAIMMNLFYYHNDERNLINLNNQLVRIVWKLIEPTLQRTITNYDARTDTSRQNGKLGGRPRKQQETPAENLNNLNKTYSIPNETKKPDNVIDSVSDCVIESDCVSVVETHEKTATNDDNFEKKNKEVENQTPAFVEANREKLTTYKAPPAPPNFASWQECEVRLNENEHIRRIVDEKHKIRGDEYGKLVADFVNVQLAKEDKLPPTTAGDLNMHFLSWINTKPTNTNGKSHFGDSNQSKFKRNSPNGFNVANVDYSIQA
jgi:hypothetical protein